MQRKTAGGAHPIKKTGGKVLNTKGKAQNYKRDIYSKVKTNPPKK